MQLEIVLCKEKGTAFCYQRKVQKSVMVWGCISAHVYFSRTMLGLIMRKLQQSGLVDIEYVCLTGMPVVQICLLLKMYGASWRGESDNSDSWAAVIHQVWATIPLAKIYGSHIYSIYTLPFKSLEWPCLFLIQYFIFCLYSFT